MYQTIEAIYDNGVLYPINDKIPSKHMKVLITIVEDLDGKKGINLSEIKKISGTIKDKNVDALEYQRSVRNEW